MGTSRVESKKRAPSMLASMLVLCASCLALNVLGWCLASLLNLPVYLDSLGTVLAAMIGGYVPGIIVGYLTNFIIGLFDSSAIYYGVVNVLFAIVVAYLSNRGWFKKLPLTMLAILILTLLSGVLGTALAFLLNGANLGPDMSSVLARQLHAYGVPSLVAAQFIAEVFVNLIDKTLVVLFATLVYHLISEDFLARLDFAPWRQAPLSADDLEKTMSAKPRTISFTTKLAVLVVTIIAIVASVTMALSYFTFHQSKIATESMKAENVTALMAQKLDPAKVKAFIAEGESAPGYREAEAEIASIRDAFEEVDYAYVYQIRKDGCFVVIDPDKGDEPGSDYGTVIPFEESFEQYLPTLLNGGQIEPVVSNDSYGWLLTVYTPYKDESGNTLCYLGVDVSMAQLESDEFSFLTAIGSLFVAFFILVSALLLWLAKYNIIVPLNSISRASNDFMLDTETLRSASVDELDSLDIRTGDEIENLYHAVGQTSRDAVHYIADAQEKSATITRMQDNLIMVMADLVESRDKYTGDHVRNTATYARIIMNQMRREGIHPEVLTNEFISNVYKSAPLHDIGKIAVSDSILNKPGRLTDEEFEIMKSHTVIGRDILENAKGAVSTPSYLDEGQRLAASHHEKWDGSGYPFGMVGEDIPLSARIMAVADVFDALVSKRSYKEGFPVDKAFAIIEEGIGTHFDPQVAQAFLHAKDKARAVVEKSNEKRRLEEERAKAGQSQPDAGSSDNADAETTASPAAESSDGARGDDAPDDASERGDTRAHADGTS